MITLFAPAKINLSLDVTGKLENGYHTLEMIMQTISLYDEIVLQRSEGGIEITCDNPLVPVDEKNICHKAATLFFKKTLCLRGVKIDIKKRIPSGAGLAGGSADAAAVLKGLNILYDAQLSLRELKELGLKCGADVPYCLTGGTCLAEGIGERLTKLPPLTGVNIVLIVPEFSVSTTCVYKNYRIDDCVKHPDTKILVKAIHKKDLLGLALGMENVLENVTAVKYPEIECIKRDLKSQGALGSLMSGSGPSTFGLYENEKVTYKAFTALKNRFRQIYMVYTVDGGRIHG